MAKIALSQPVTLVPSTTSLTLSGIYIDLDQGQAIINFTQDVGVAGGGRSVTVRLSDQMLADMSDLVKQVVEGNLGGGVTATLSAKAVSDAKVNLGK